MVEAALRGVVREALARAAAKGLPGAHHFYITFRTRFPGVALPDYLGQQYPDEMTVVLEHQFWDLDVSEACFSVTLSFQNKPERLVIPFDAITAFADPAVKFGLQFQETPDDSGAAPAEPAPAKAEEATEKPGEVVALDAFRKK
jgi:uncharacterized protein